MIPTAKEILFSRTFPGQNYHFPGQNYHFPGQNYHFPGQSIQDLKGLNHDMC